MPKPSQQHIERLRAQIDDLRYRYHVLNDPEVTDTMYEGLMDELRKIETDYPEFITQDSPTQRVAGVPLEKFRKVQHMVPQWSFNDAFDEHDLREWEERIVKMLEKKTGSRPHDLTFVSELKIDGLHIVLTYENGILKVAATRGNGLVGEDVTTNIKTIETVPLRLREPKNVIVEGEVWLSAKTLEKINEERKKNSEPLFANPRNAAAGTIRQLDARIVAERRLSFTPYDISGGTFPETQEEELTALKRLGFKTDAHWRVCQNMDEILAMWREWIKKRDSQEFWIDGLVVKVNQRKYQDLLGFTGKAPRWAIALKFPAEQGTTKIENIYVQVGRTGALTPVALMQPVRLAGTTVTHATLHNFDEIKRLDARVGDTVVVEKAGDIIPKVVRVLEKMRTGNEKVVREPRHCPICHSPVERREIREKKREKSAALFCTNPKCYAQERERIIHFVSKKAFDIDGMGEKIVEQLINEGLIKNPADIFTLTQGDLEPLDRFAEKSAQNLIDAIQQAKVVPLHRLIFGLGIPHVGEETAIRLADHFQHVEKLMNATQEELEEVQDIGPTVAQSIYEFFHDIHNRHHIEELQKNGVTIKKPQISSSRSLAGKTFVLTGTLKSLTRDEAKEKIRVRGGEISGSVSKQIDYVVVGESPGSKLDRAEALGVATLDEKQFLRIIGGQ